MCIRDRLCIDRYGPLVWSLVRGTTDDGARAETAVQEVFAVLWQEARHFDPATTSESNFITVIARRKLTQIGLLPGRGAGAPPVGEPPRLRRPGAAARYGTEDDTALAREAIAELNPQQKQVLELAVVRGLSPTRIATATGLSRELVHNHLRRGLERVRELLEGAPRSAPPGGQP